MPGQMLLMSGNAHPALSAEVADYLGTELVNAEVGQFPDGETKVKIEDNVREQDVFVIQPTGPPTSHNTMEALIVIDALRRASAGRITAVMPYFGYARQDRKDASRVPISAKLMIDLFTESGIDRFLAVDLHASQMQGMTNLPFDHLYAERTLAQAILDDLKPGEELPVIAAPDVGAGKMAESYARRLDALTNSSHNQDADFDYAVVTKKRIDGSTTRAQRVMGQSVVGRRVIIVDDMVTTGDSLLKAAAGLKEEGALSVEAAITHGVLCGDALERIDASEELDGLYVTNTLPQRGKSQKVRPVTIAPLLAKGINNIHDGRSVTKLIA